MLPTVSKSVPTHSLLSQGLFLERYHPEGLFLERYHPGWSVNSRMSLQEQGWRENLQMGVSSGAELESPQVNVAAFHYEKQRF